MQAGLDQLQGLADFMGQARPAPLAEPIDLAATVESLLAESARLWEPAHPMTALLGRMLALWARALDGIAQESDRDRLSAGALEMLLASRERIPPEELADAFALCAEFARDAGDRERAVELAREAWEAARVGQESGAERKERWNTALARLHVGRCLFSLGLDQEAETLLAGAHATLLAQLGPKHAHTLQARATLHELYTSLGKTDQAAQYADVEPR